MLTKEQIAKVCHDVNKAYCEALGDISQPTWDNAPQWQKDSAMLGVELHVNNPQAGPDDSHNSWLKQKKEEGWKYGPIKNPEMKEHPCFVAYEDLPQEQQAKDYIFRSVVHSLAQYLDNGNPYRKAIEKEVKDQIELEVSNNTSKTVDEFLNPVELPLTITEEHIDHLCSDPDKIQYTLFPNTFHTVCCISLPNGATVIGSSVCASSKVFDETKGKEWALKDARDKVWQFEGYTLCEKRYQVGLIK